MSETSPGHALGLPCVGRERLPRRCGNGEAHAPWPRDELVDEAKIACPLTAPGDLGQLLRCASRALTRPSWIGAHGLDRAREIVLVAGHEGGEIAVAEVAGDTGEPRRDDGQAHVYVLEQ